MLSFGFLDMKAEG